MLPLPPRTHKIYADLYLIMMPADKKKFENLKKTKTYGWLFWTLIGRFEDPCQMVEWIFVASAASLLAIGIPLHPMKFLLTGLAEWLAGTAAFGEEARQVSRNHRGDHVV